MSQVRNRPMCRKDRGLTPWGSVVAVVALLLLSAMALTGCAEPAVIAAVEPTPTAYPIPPADIPTPAPGPTPVALGFPLPAPTHVEVEAADDQSCIDCHTDEETLKAVAKEEEGGGETLSEGEG
jgi:hypothetical protein